MTKFENNPAVFNYYTTHLYSDMAGFVVSPNPSSAESIHPRAGGRQYVANKAIRVSV